MCIIIEGYAQKSNFNFEHITTDHGLSSNKVESILQDRDGLYWIATKNGLNRFDGTNFKIFRNDPDDSTSLTHNNCTNLLEDTNGDIWVSTYKGISRFSKKHGVFAPLYFDHPTKNSELSNRIFKMVSDPEGHVWISGNGLWKYNLKNQEVTLISIADQNPGSISEDGLISDMCYDSLMNGLWMMAGGQLNFYSIADNVFYHSRHNPMHWVVFDMASANGIELDHENRLWFREKSNGELCYFEGHSNQIHLTGNRISSSLRHMTADKSNRIWLSYWGSRAEIFDPITNQTDSLFFMVRHRHSVLQEISRLMYVDHQNNYWTSSGAGISIYNDANQYYRWHAMTNGPLDNAATLSIKSIVEGTKEHLWVATTKGLFDYNLQDNSYRQVNDIRKIRSMCVVGEDLWLAVNGHILQMNMRSGLILKKIQLQDGIIFIQKGNFNELWVGIWTGGLYRIELDTYEVEHITKQDREQSLKSNSLVSNLVDGENLWIGYNIGNGFSKYNIPKKHFTHYHPNTSKSFDSNTGTVTVLSKDHQDNIWIGTHGSGIFRFDQQSETYQNYQQHDGLKSNYVNSILPDLKNNLWISSVDGISLFYDQTKTILPLEIDLILVDNDFVQNSYSASGKKLYFFSKNEFVEIDPDAYQQSSAFPQLVMSSFNVFDTELPLYGQPKEIKLSHHQNFFTVGFSAIKAHPLKKVSYAYKLEGFDKDWIPSGIQQEASYTNVPHGKYTFKIKATNEAGEWSDVLLSSAIRISPPFWKTWWFMSLSFFLIACLIYFLYKYRISQLKRIYMIKSKISQDLHDEVGSTLSSIHVYSSVASKSLENNMDITRKALSHINQNSRQAMDNMSDIVWAINSGHPGTSTLEDKLKNYGYELLTPLNINVSYTIHDDVEKKLNHMGARKNILLIVKEAMNNIARYSKATTASVEVDINHKNLVLSIGDNGKGFDQSTQRNGNGLHNMRHRTESLGGVFILTSYIDQGTKLTCTIPVTSISNT